MEMEKGQSQLEVPIVELDGRLESLTEFNDNEKFILKLMIIQKVRMGLLARLQSHLMEYAPKVALDSSKVLSIDQFSLGQEENRATLAIANQLGIDAQRFKELFCFVIENEQTW